VLAANLQLTRKSDSPSERTLILCVDRDDDLGVKAEVKTPIVGREQNVNAAVSLALRDPEESDSNAIFEAVRIYDRLREDASDGDRGECQIATITGSELGDVGADKKLVGELNDVLKIFPATEVVLVTDGFADETVLPVVQSRVPVTSVRRITVRHSESIEETVWLFSRYLKRLFEDPKYARIALGLPGLLLITIGVLSVLNLLVYTWIAFLIVLGAVLFIKGFMLDKAARDFYMWVKEYSPPPFTVQIASFAALAGFLLMGLGVYLGGNHVAAFVANNKLSTFAQWIAVLPQMLGEFISRSIFLIVTGISVLLLGRAIRWFFERDSRLLRTVVIIVVVAWSWQVFFQASQILINPNFAYGMLIFAIIMGIVLAVASVLVTSLIHRMYADFFREKEDKIEES
jgi:putative membrane protein